MKHKKNYTLRFFMWLFSYKMVDYELISKGKYIDKLIENCLQTNGFVVLNKRGEYYLKDFTMIELVREKNKDGKGIISVIKIKHDIDSVVDEKTKMVTIAGRFSGLQRMIDYFMTI